MAGDIAFEDLEVGGVSTFGPRRVEREEMLGFARRYDAQPFHTSEEEAARTPVGRLIASGWFNTALQMRILCDGWVLRAKSRGGIGLDELRWLRPVVEGDILSVRQTIVDKRLSKSMPGIGLVRVELELLNEGGEAMMRSTQTVLIASRDAPPPSLRPQIATGEPAPTAPPDDPAAAPRVYDDVEIGRVTDLGTYAFTAERVIGFARRFDPQPFHLSEAEGAAGPFGALAASGWQTTAAWMGSLSVRLMRLETAGGRPNVSVSPGFRELKWPRPVYAGETIRFATEVEAKRPVASRPGWGLVSTRNTGWNARGECVLSFLGSAFWAMRGGGGGTLAPRF
jgi:acyl dehydratase